MTEAERTIIAAAKVVANKLSRKFRSFPKDEILSEAYLGASIALRKFDSTLNTKLFAYAYTAANRAVIRYISKSLYGSSVVLEERRPTDDDDQVVLSENIDILATELPKQLPQLLGERATASDVHYVGFPGVDDARMVEALKGLRPSYKELLFDLLVLGKTMTEVSKATGRRVYFLNRQYESALKQLREAYGA